MLEIATLNWGYFHTRPADGEVRRLLDEGQQVARLSGDNVSLARLLMERAAYTGDPAGTDEVLSFLESDDAVRYADAGHRMGQTVLWSGDLTRSLELYRRVFEDLLPRGALINEPEALMWYSLTLFWAGDLSGAREMAGRFRADLAKGRSPHIRSHVLGVESLIALGSGDWDWLLRIIEELEAFIAAHPDDSFCLVGGAAIGYGAAARLRAGIALPNDMAADAARMMESSELVRASSILLPEAMLGDVEAIERGLLAYEPGLPLADRAAVWDVLHLLPAMTWVMLERWDLLDQSLARMEYCAAHGSRLAEALLEAIAEERAGEAAPRHDRLRALGYDGISQLLRIRARARQAQPA